MSLFVFLETTIPSYLASWPSRDVVVAGKQEVTREWWKQRRNKFELFVSPYVLEEVSAGDLGASERRMELIQNIPILSIDDTVLELTEAILIEKVIPQKSAADASHIAIATRHGMDFLMTWNCAHIANAEIMRIVKGVMEKAGYELPLICTPNEQMGDYENNE